LVDAIDAFWLGESKALATLKPVDAAVTLLANRIASYPNMIDACQEYTDQCCRVKVSEVSRKKGKEALMKNRDDKNFKTYYGFDNLLSQLRDHQALAIR
jgi:transcriptional accessory protein Tex/SPT6